MAKPYFELKQDRFAQVVVPGTNIVLTADIDHFGGGAASIASIRFMGDEITRSQARTLMKAIEMMGNHLRQVGVDVPKGHGGGVKWTYNDGDYAFFFGGVPSRSVVSNGHTLWIQGGELDPASLMRMWKVIKACLDVITKKQQPASVKRKPPMTWSDWLKRFKG